MGRQRNAPPPQLNCYLSQPHSWASPEQGLSHIVTWSKQPDSAIAIPCVRVTAIMCSPQTVKKEENKGTAFCIQGGYWGHWGDVAGRTGKFVHVPPLSPTCFDGINYCLRYLKSLMRNRWGYQLSNEIKRLWQSSPCLLSIFPTKVTGKKGWGIHSFWGSKVTNCIFYPTPMPLHCGWEGNRLVAQEIVLAHF